MNQTIDLEPEQWRSKDRNRWRKFNIFHKTERERRWDRIIMGTFMAIILIMGLLGASGY